MSAVAGALALDMQPPVSAPAAAYLALEALLELYEDERTGIVPASALPAIRAAIAASGTMAPHLAELDTIDYERLGRYAAGTPPAGLPRVLAFVRRTLVPQNARALALADERALELELERERSLALALELLEDRARAGETPAFDAARGAVLRAARYALPVAQLFVGADGDEAFATRVLRGAVLAKDAASTAFALERGARLDTFVAAEQRVMRARVGEYARVLLELLRHVDAIEPELTPSELLLAAVHDARTPVSFIAEMRRRLGPPARDVVMRALVTALDVGVLINAELFASVLGDDELGSVRETSTLVEYTLAADGGAPRWYTAPRWYAAPLDGYALATMWRAELCASSAPTTVLGRVRELRRERAARFFSIDAATVRQHVLIDVAGALRRVSDALRMPRVQAYLATVGYEGVFTPDARVEPFDVGADWAPVHGDNDDDAHVLMAYEVFVDAADGSGHDENEPEPLRAALRELGCVPPPESWLAEALRRRDPNALPRKRVRARVRAAAYGADSSADGARRLALDAAARALRDGNAAAFARALLAFRRFSVPLALALEAYEAGDAFTAAVRERGVEPHDAEEALEAALEALYASADEDGYGHEELARARALVAIGARVSGLSARLADLYHSLDA